MSTYWKVDAGLGMLVSPLASVTITSAGPAPSCGAGASGGRASRAGGRVADREVALRTVKRLAGICAAPTSIAATSGDPPDSNPVPVIAMCSPPAVLPDAGLSPVTTGRLAWPARLHR